METGKTLQMRHHHTVISKHGVYLTSGERELDTKLLHSLEDHSHGGGQVAKDDRLRRQKKKKKDNIIRDICVILDQVTQRNTKVT